MEAIVERPGALDVHFANVNKSFVKARRRIRHAQARSDDAG
jgi:hypothetical protein